MDIGDNKDLTINAVLLNSDTSFNISTESIAKPEMDWND